MPNKYKGKNRGARILVDWGQVQVIRAGKKTKVNAYSYVLKDNATQFGLKEVTKPTGRKVAKDKKGRQRFMGGAVIAKSASKYVLVWDGKEKTKSKKNSRPVFHRIPIPAQVSEAAASKLLAGKATVIKFPNGREELI